MTEEVDKDKLQIALNDVLPRFEAYRVRLKKGYAWHFSNTTTHRARSLRKKRF